MRVRARVGVGSLAGALVAAVLVTVGSAPAGALTGPAGITRVSVSTSGEAADISTPTLTPPAISADGRYIAFDSFADLLTSAPDGAVYVRDTNAGTTTVASVKKNGTTDDAADTPALSGDGRYVAFVTDSTGLVTGGNSNFYQVYVRDRTTGATVRASTKPNGVQGTDDSGHPSLSNDGRYLAFESDSPGLVAGDTNDTTDVFVRDQVAGTLKRVSLTNGGAEADFGGDTPTISGDGRYVAFISYDQLSAEDTNDFGDVYVRDTLANTTTLVSKPAGGGVANDNSSDPVISADGKSVAFVSNATNLDGTTDDNGATDVFVRSLQSNTTTRVSRNASGGLAHGIAGAPSISGDGRFVAYESTAADAVSGDTNGMTDSFVFDRNSSTTSRISTDQLGEQLATGGTYPVLSANGAFVTFSTASPITGLGPSSTRQLYVRLTVPLNPSSLPQVSVGNASVAEGNTKTRQLRFAVTLSKPSPAPTSVTYATLPGTATTADYTAKTGVVTIPAGATTASVPVPVKGDTASEPNETFSLVLAAPQGATLRRSIGTGTITNDDPAAGATTRVSIGNASLVEGSSGTRTLRFAVTASIPKTTAITVSYGTQAVTASAADYTGKSGSIKIPASSASGVISISVKSDSAVEASETFKVKLTAVSAGSSIQFGTGTGTILDDDGG
jgi:Tol biopolymer transport system component